MIPTLLTPGPMTRDRVAVVNDAIEELTRLTWFTATYPIILDKTATGWLISFDVDGLRGTVVNNPVNGNPVNPVDGEGIINNFNFQGAPTINITDSTGPTTITGFLPAPPGTEITIQNNTLFPIYIEHLNPGSDDPNQIITPTKTTLIIPPCSSATMKYGKGTDPDDPKWGIVSPSPPIYEPILPPQITGNETSYNPGSDTPNNIITSDAPRILYGIVPAPNYYPRTFTNTGSFAITFPHDSTSAGDDSYRFYTPDGKDLILRPNQTATFYYDPVLDRNIIVETTSPFSGLTNKKLPKFDGTSLTDSVISEDAGGVITVGGSVTASGQAATDVPLLAKAHASQTAALVSAADASGNFYSGFNKAGYFMTRKKAAPADGDLAASELSLWFDDTDGAGKLMIKAKTADGTVVTGSVNLT
jgi:hypothetical protein